MKLWWGNDKNTRIHHAKHHLLASERASVSAVVGQLISDLLVASSAWLSCLRFIVGHCFSLIEIALLLYYFVKVPFGKFLMETLVEQCNFKAPSANITNPVNLKFRVLCIRRVRRNQRPIPFDADNDPREVRPTRFSISYPVLEIFAKNWATSVGSGIRRILTNPRLAPFYAAIFAGEARPTGFSISYRVLEIFEKTGYFPLVSEWVSEWVNYGN